MKIDINFWLGFFGVIITIIFGILSIYLVKSKKYPGRLTFISEQTIGLFDSIIKNFPQIAITYNGKSIDQQIVMLKGFLINSGSIDIKDDMVEENLKLKLPEKFKWLNVKIVDSTKGSKATTTIESDNEFFFHLGLFRKNEFLRFEALVYIPQTTEKQKSATTILLDELKFEHRISDTNKVEFLTKSLDLPNLKKKLFLPFFYSIILIFYTIFLSSYIIPKKDISCEFKYYLKSANSIDTLTATPHINNTVDLIKIDGSKYKTISIQEFNTNFQKAEIKEWKSSTWLGKNIRVIYLISVIILGFLFIMFFIFTIINPVMEFRKINRLRQTLNINKISF